MTLLYQLNGAGLLEYLSISTNSYNIFGIYLKIYLKIKVVIGK